MISSTDQEASEMGYFSNQLVEMSESPDPGDQEHAERVMRRNRAVAAGSSSGFDKALAALNGMRERGHYVSDLTVQYNASFYKVDYRALRRAFDESPTESQQ